MSILQNNLPAVPWAHDLDHIFQYFDIYYNQINKFKKKFPNFIYELELDNLILIDLVGPNRSTLHDLTSDR